MRTFGWQGISLTVPPEWDLVHTRGTARSGQCRLADEASMRLELRWQPAERRVSAAAVLDGYVDRLARQARKNRFDFDVERGLNLAAPPGWDVECYRWTAERRMIGMLAICTECRRLVHVHLAPPAGQGGRRLARTVFGSLRDHPQEGTPAGDRDWALWSFLDVEFCAPRYMPLVQSSLKAGCVRMLFRKGLSRLEFVRVSLAQVLLARQGMQDWVRSFYAKQLKRRTVHLDQAEVHGHAGLAMSGRPWLLMDVPALVSGRRVLRGACWHCDRSNRLMLCCLDGSRRYLPALERAVSSFRCCPGA